MPEPRPNNPYARPINATRPDAVLVSEHYGSRSTDKRRSHETGGRDVSPANRFQSGVTAVPQWPDEAPTKPKAKRAPKTTPSPEPTSLNTDSTSPTDADSGVVTEDDLFG